MSSPTAQQSTNAVGQGAGSGKRSSTSGQFSTFTVAGRLYGIDVTKVQEVVKPLAMTRVPLAPNYIKGLINLRGQVATAIGLWELFDLPGKPGPELMNVVCKAHGTLLSLQVDEIGDVLEVNQDAFESPPATIQEGVRRFLGGIYKINGRLLSVIDLEPLAKFLGLSAGQRSVS